MTLQNGLLTDDAAYLWTDTGMYSGKTEVGHLPKVQTVPGLSCALVHSGTLGCMGMIGDNLTFHQPKSVDAVIDIVQGTLHALMALGFPQSVLIASYDTRPRLHFIETEPNGEYAPLTALPVAHHICSSGDDPMIAEAVEGGVTLENMPYIIEAQHSDRGRETSALFSGALTCVKVSAEGVELELVGDLPPHCLLPLNDPSVS